MRNNLHTIKFTYIDGKVSFNKCMLLCNQHHSQDMEQFYQIPFCSSAVNSLASPPRNQWSNLHDYSFALLEFHLMESYYSIQSLVSGFFHFAKCFWDTSMLLHVKIVVPFYWVEFHCIDIAQCVHLFTSWWTFRLFPVWGYYK